MPKLLVFAPCEKVIISQDENNPTLIAILTEMGAQYQTLADAPELPDSISLPMRWAIFAMWQQEPGDDGKMFTQRIEFRSPANKQVIKQTDQDFAFEKPLHRIVMHMPGFPNNSGLWMLKLYLTEKDVAFSDEPLATYPLTIKVEKQTSASSETTT